MEAECGSSAPAAAADAAADREPVALVLDGHTLVSMTELLLRICWDASRLTIAQGPPPPKAGAGGGAGGSSGGQRQYTAQVKSRDVGSCGSGAVLAGACSSSSGGGSGEAWLQVRGRGWVECVGGVRLYPLHCVALRV